MDNKNKTVYLDYLRGAATLFVILLHAITPHLSAANFTETRSFIPFLILNEFCRIGVPLFFMISGYLLLNSEASLSITAFYKKRLPRILLPLLVWNIIYYLCKNLAAFGEMGAGAFFKGMFAAIIDNGTSYHFWFVYTLLGIYLITPFLKRIVDACTEKQLWWFLCLIAFTGTIRPFLNTVLPIYIRLFDPLAEGYMAYFLFGYLLGKFPLSGIKKWTAYAMGILGAVIGIGGNALMLAAGKAAPFNGGYFITHFLAAGALFVLAQNLPFLQRDSAEKCGKFMREISFGIYFVHVIALGLVGRLGFDLSPLLSAAVSFVLATLISTAVAILLWLIKPIRRFVM